MPTIKFHRASSFVGQDLVTSNYSEQNWIYALTRDAGRYTVEQNASDKVVLKGTTASGLAGWTAVLTPVTVFGAPPPGSPDRWTGAIKEMQLFNPAGELVSTLTELGTQTVFHMLSNDHRLWGSGATILGSDGNDSPTGFGPGDLIDGGDGDDFIDGGYGVVRPDYLIGGRGADTIRGGGGDDFILAGGGDSIEGGDGADQITIDAALPGTLRVDGGSGSDVVDFTGGREFVSIDLDQAAVRAGASDFRNVEIVILGDGGSSVRGGANRDGVIGGGGVDEIFGGEGADLLAGRDGDDRCSGKAGTTCSTAASAMICWTEGPGSTRWTTPFWTLVGRGAP